MEGVPSDLLLLLPRRESRHVKADKNGGEKIRKGEGLIPLCRRKYLSIKENELKVVGVGGRGNCAGSWEENCCLQWGWFACSRVGRGERRGWGGRHLFFFLHGEEGLVMKARGERERGGQVAGDHVPFNLEKRKEREKKMSLK